MNRTPASLYLIISVVAVSVSLACGAPESLERQVEKVAKSADDIAKSVGGQVGDVAITAQVKAKIASDISLDASGNIDVDTTNGVVTLTGQVQTEEIKNLAGKSAAGVSGVVRVENNLRVPSVSP